jgi:hypothetical protein
MKRHLRLLYLFLLILVFLFACIGCDMHQHCVEWTTTQVPYCCKYGNGYCESTCYRTQNICARSVCDAGYERVAGKGKCVPIE